jgi:hypothetical protein
MVALLKPTPRPSLLALTLVGTLLFHSVAGAQVPQLISYEGRVAVGGVNFDSVTAGQPGLFKFALVSPDGTQTYWSNDGTSVAGSEPTAAVALTVTKGLYSVLLGNTAVPFNMSPINAAVFAHPDVRLRVWFSNGTNGSQLLSPDRRIASVAYAVIAGEVADGSVSAAKIAPGAVGSTHLSANSVQAGSIAAGAVDNTKLADATVTVTPGAGLGGGGVVSLGGGITLTNSGVLSLTGGGGITVNAANGNVTLGSNATEVGTGGTIVMRDANGNFAAGTITANLAGNATSATSALSAVSAVSATSAVTALTAGSAADFTGALVGDVTGMQGSTVVGKIDGIVPSSANVPDSVVRRNGDGDFAAGTIAADLFVGNGASLTGIPGTLAWQSVTGTAQNAAANTGYLATNVAPVTVTLPALVQTGDIVRVTGVGAGGWAVVPNIGQSVVGFGAGLGPAGPQGGGAAVQFIGFNQWQVLSDAQLLAGSVQASHLAAGAVGTAQLAPNAVQAGSIAVGAVENSKLANAGFTLNTGAGLAGGGSVDLGGTLTLSVPDAGVTGPKLADDAVSTSKIATGAVTNAKLANSAVTINAGAGLTGTSTVSLGGNVTLSIPNGGVTAAQLAPGAAAANYAADGQSFGIINGIPVNQWLGTAGTPTFAGQTILNTGTGYSKPGLILDRGIVPKGRVTFQKTDGNAVWSGLVLSINADWSDTAGYLYDDDARSQSILQMEYEYLDTSGNLLNEINWTVNGYRVLALTSDVNTTSRSTFGIAAPLGIDFPVANPAALQDTAGRILVATAARDGSDIQAWIGNYSSTALGSGLHLASRSTTNAWSDVPTDWVSLWALYSDPRGVGANEFGIMDRSVGSYRFLINQAGNIGIKGNINPQYALDVNGDVNVTGTFRINGIVSTVPKQGLSRLAVELPSVNATTQAVVIAPGSYTPAVRVNEGLNVAKMMSLDPTTWKGRSVKVGMLVAVNGTSGQNLAYRLMISYTTKALDGTDNTAVFPDPGFAEAGLPNASYPTVAAPVVAGAAKWIESAPITIPTNVTAVAASFELAKADGGDTNTDTAYIIEARVTEQ